MKKQNGDKIKIIATKGLRHRIIKAGPLYSSMNNDLKIFFVFNKI